MFVRRTAAVCVKNTIRISLGAFRPSKIDGIISRRFAAPVSSKKDAITVDERNIMPPKKPRLASKVRNLTSFKDVLNGDKTPRLNVIIRSKNSDTAQLENDQNASGAAPKSKLNLRNLKAKLAAETEAEEPKRAKDPRKRALRAVVDIEMMKKELKQLEDPPVTPEEKILSANRLGLDFFDVPSVTLARNLLGKILVRRLENGTILKGRIVETESYLGGEDRASQTYGNKVTPRNVPMYMEPGTIYVYLTYGMYHCFNISSRAPGASVFIRAVEPTIGLSYMELLRNTQLKKGSKSKEMTRKLKILKPHQLCNGPSKLCTAFDIDKETFNEKNICKSSGLWIENDKEEDGAPITIVAAPRVGIESAGEGSCVLIRALSPIDGMQQMAEFRNSKPTANSKSRSLRRFKDHELSNGPSKFCMAFGLSRDHSKYSICSWKGLWIEDNRENGDIEIIQCPRIGIDSAGPEWALKPLRFYIFGEKSVSKIDKKAEAAAAVAK